MKIFHMKPVVSGEEIILRSIGCQKSDPSYKEFENAFREVKGETFERLDPAAAVSFGRIPEDFPKSIRFYGRDLFFFCITVGGSVTELSDKYMSRGEFVKGMIVDGIADNCLFSCEKIVLHEIEKYARDNDFGIEGLYDAPDMIEGKMQKVIASVLKAEKNLGVRVTESYMMSPVKTYAAVMPTVKDPSVMKIYHNCAECDKKDCSYRSSGGD